MWTDFESWTALMNCIKIIENYKQCSCSIFAFKQMTVITNAERNVATTVASCTTAGNKK